MCRSAARCAAMKQCNGGRHVPALGTQARAFKVKPADLPWAPTHMEVDGGDDEGSDHGDLDQGVVVERTQRRPLLWHDSYAFGLWRG